MKRLAVLMLVSLFVLGSMAFAWPVVRAQKFSRVQMPVLQASSTVKVRCYYNGYYSTTRVRVSIIELDDAGHPIAGSGLSQWTDRGEVYFRGVEMGKNYRVTARLANFSYSRPLRAPRASQDLSVYSTYHRVTLVLEDNGNGRANQGTVDLSDFGANLETIDGSDLSLGDTLKIGDSYKRVPYPLYLKKGISRSRMNSLLAR